MLTNRTETKYLTTLVRYKRKSDRETAFEDVAITFSNKADFWSQMAEWLDRRAQAYPPETWDYWTTVCEQPGKWRGVPHLPPEA